MANAEISLSIDDDAAGRSLSEAEYKARIQAIGSRLNGTNNLNDALANTKDEICELFGSDRLTVYVVDGVKRELVSRFKSGNELAEIRIPIAQTSVAGYAALKQALLNIKDAYDQNELTAIDPSLQFDSSWDRRSGYRTRQILAYPIVYQKYLMGTVELINHKSGVEFGAAEQSAIQELAKIMGVVLYNQKRIAAKGSRTNNKYDYLLENHLLTQKELAKAAVEAAQRKEPVSAVLMKDYKIPKRRSAARSRNTTKPISSNTTPTTPFPVISSRASRYPSCATTSGCP